MGRLLLALTKNDAGLYSGTGEETPRLLEVFVYFMDCIGAWWVGRWGAVVTIDKEETLFLLIQSTETC
jgi:hypothetical protein